MKKETRLLIFTVLVAVIAIALIVFRYEKLLKNKNEVLSVTPVKGGVPVKEYTAEEIITLIKSSKEYIGDSITIFENGKIQSSNHKFFGTISAVVESEANMALVKSNCIANNLPLQYNIYALAATFYRQQYPEEFKK
jgi:pilus assembly protein TadC